LTLPAIDWSQPWLAPWRARGQGVSDGLAQNGSVAQALNAIAGESCPVRFVPQAELPEGRAYEAHIFQTHRVPTRDNLHDFFGGIVWLACPLTKQRLNELQAAEIERLGVGATRGPLRDALTLFDENGAVLDAPPPLWDALVARDWHRLFVTERARWREARLRVFGHALLEKLVSPRKVHTAHVLVGPGTARSIGTDDASIARALAPAHLARKPFVPLQVLGVPGWWAPNEAPGFYADAEVFRPPRREAGS
jgi:hypothetical protein